MAKPTATVDSKNRVLKKGYATLGNKNRKLKKGYITRNGINVKIWSGAFEYSYSGVSQFFGNPEGDWELVLLSSGTLNIESIDTAVDIFSVGGGSNGEKGEDVYGGGHSGGNGGNGGQCVTETGKTVAEGSYPIVIGSPGINTSGLGVNATSGGGKPGGVGTMNTAAGDGADGELAFGGTTEYENGRRYGASGGGGTGVDQFGQSGTPGIGGETGAGNGGDTKHSFQGGDATENTGSGGGGSYQYADRGGNGANGIMIIRNHRGG